MKRRNFIASIAALFASTKIKAEEPVKIVWDNPEDSPLLYHEKLHKNPKFGKTDVIGKPAHLTEVIAMEPLKKGDLCVIDMETGKARKAKFDSDLVLGIIVEKSFVWYDRYIIAVH
jgi:hypothetical protein